MRLLATEAETVLAGRELATALQPGDVLALVGNLGAGKTHLTKGIVLALGSVAEVTSPTFGLLHEYRGGKWPVFHFDFYRLESEREVEDLGWDDYLKQGGITIVEWADKFPALLPAGTHWWQLSHDPATGGRRLTAISD